MKKGRKLQKEKKDKITKLVNNGFNYQDIADMLQLKSRQIARYHHLYTGLERKDLTKKKKGI